MYGQRQSFFSNIPPVVKNLLILNVLIWGAMALSPVIDRFMDRHLALYYFTSPAFEAFQLFTYMFLHSGFTHLFFNMFALFMFGRTMEMVMGSQRFLFYYISCGIGAALFQLGVFAIRIHYLEALIPGDVAQQVIDEGLQVMRNGYNYSNGTYAALNAYVNTPMVGASGAIYGVLLAFGYLFPNHEIYIIPFPMPIKAKWLVVGYFVLELFMGMRDSAGGVAHFAHLGGMIFGFLLLWYWKRKGVLNNRWFF